MPNDYNCRPGMNVTHGLDFELQMMAYLAVASCNNRDIKDWWIACNMEGVGHFDDVVLFLETGNGERQLFLMQLKHRLGPRRKKLTIIELIDKQYLHSFHQIRALMTNKTLSQSTKRTETLLKATGVPLENMQFVYLTNTVCNAEHTHLKKVPNSYFFATNPCGQAYQLDPYLAENPDEKMFRSQFHILTEQIGANYDYLLKKIASDLKTYFNSNSNFNEYFTVAKELTYEIEKWFKENYKKLTLQHFQEIIAKSVLSKFVQVRMPDRQYNKLQDPEFALWQQITAPFQLVVFDNESSEMGNFFNATNFHLFIKCEDNCIDVVIKCLEINKQQKVVLKKSINSLAPFQQLLNEYEIKTFKCLSNLSENFIDILGECSLWLQGRKVDLKSLLSLDPNLANVFDVDDVINLISNKLYIGDDLKPLSYYVPRSVPRIFLKKSVIVEKPNSYFIIIVDDANCYEECIAKVDNVIKNAYSESDMVTTEVNFLSVTKNGVNKAMLNVNEKYKSVHVLAFHEHKSDFLFEWVTSTKNVSEIESFIDTEIDNMPPIGQNEIDLVLNCSEKVLVLGNPGMGKSFYLRSLFNKYSTDSWILFVTLNELVNAKTNNFQACLDYCVSKINKKSRQIFDVYLERKSVVVLFDGFDEIAPYYENEGLKIIKGASELGLKIVVMSRFVKGNDLEENLDIMSRTLQPFTEENKTEFLVNYYSKEVENINNSNASDLSQEVTPFVAQLLTNISLSSWDSDFTGVPLQCRLIAESFADEFLEYCKTGNLKLPEKLNLLSLYKRFIDTKFNIFWSEKEDLPERSASQKILKEQQIALFTQNHIAAAVQIIFPSLDKKISEEYLINIRNGEEKYGIITGVDSNDNPVFIHRTFADYFAAKWLVDIKKAGSEKERTKYLKNLLNPEYNVVKDLFDRLVCRDCELHTAILNADKEEVLRLLEREGREGEKKCGRSALHLLCARGATHEWDGRTITRREEESHLDVLDVFLSSGVCDAGKDQVLGWTAQQYAEDRKAFGVIDTLIKYKQFNESDSLLLPESKLDTPMNKKLRREENIFQVKDNLLKMCCEYDYVNLAEKLIQSRGLTSRDLEAIKCEYYDMVGGRSEGSLLQVAAHFGSSRLLKLLLGYIQVDIRDREGRTALYCACMRGHLSSAQLLISRGADPFAQNEMGRTPMHMAIKGRSRELVQFMTCFDILKAGYGDNVNFLLGSRTALQWAIEAGNLVSVQQILMAGAEPSVRDNRGWTALHQACEKGNVEIVRLLIQVGVEPDVRDKMGWTAFHVAAWWGKKEVVEEFVRSGANTDILNNEQRTALTLAAQREEKETFLYLWPLTSRHTTHDVRYCTILMEDLSQEKVRRNTFMDCPSHLVSSKEELVRAGFYYLGEDKVRCFKCDCLLENWQPSDDPWVRHAQINPDCIHVRVIKETRMVIENDGKTQLIAASEAGHTEIVKLLLADRANVNSVDDDGKTALMRASQRGHTDIVKLLLEHNAQVNSVDDEGKTALLWSITNNHPETVRFLLGKLAELYSIDKPDRTALMRAVQMQHRELVEFCLRDKKDDINAVDVAGRTALMWACYKGNSDIVELLLGNEQDIDVVDNYGKSALMWATEMKRTEIVKLLLDKGADVNVKNTCKRTVLMWASEEGDAEMVKFLLVRKANVTEGDDEGRTALMAASQEGHTDIVRMLVAEGAEVDAVDKSGRTALIKASIRGQLETVKLLIESKADVNLANRKGNTENAKPNDGNCSLFENEGRTALINASARSYTDIVKLLLVCGADVNSVDDYGRTALMAAISGGHRAIVQLLFEGGANVNQEDNDGKTALMVASAKGDVQTVQLLINRKADLNSVDREGKTPLMYALAEENTEVMALLANNNAKVNLCDKSGKPMQIFASVLLE